MHLDCNVTDVTEMIIWRYSFGKKQRNIFSSPEYSNALGWSSPHATKTFIVSQL